MRKVAARFLLLSILLLGAFFYYLFYQFPHTPLNVYRSSVVVVVPKGSGSKAFIGQLMRQGVLTSWQGRWLRLWLRLKGSDKYLQAGEYAIALSSTPASLTQKLIRGEVVQHAFTVVEGITFAQMLSNMHKHPAIKKTLAGASAQAIMAMIGEPLFCEGLFFPDTYYFPRDFTDLALLKRAHRTLQLKLAHAWEGRAPNLIVKTPYEALIMASIIEKETAIAQERPIIAGILQRRILKDMRLQVDPSVIYGLKDAFVGRLTSAQLKQDTPYNTYMHKGLPPTPIALPGLTSIEAALHPQEGSALYFVAKGDGTHYFSATLEEHNLAVAKYQRGGSNGL